MAGQQVDIFEVLRGGNVQTLVDILEKNPNLVNEIDMENEEITVLMSAIESKNMDILRTVLKHKPDVNATNQYNMTALHSATKLGNMECVKQLMELGAQFTKGMCGSPLSVAVFHGQLALVEYYLSLGMDPNAENLLAEAIVQSNEDVLDFLLKNGSDINKQFDSMNALHIAAAKGDVSSMKLLLDAGGKVDVIDSLGTTALHIATRSGHVGIVKLLIERGADPNIRDHSFCKLSPCHYAAQLGRSECLKILLRHGADPDVTDQDGFTPLMRAIGYQGHQTCLVLMYENCDINCRGKGLSFNHRLIKCLSPLELAVRSNFITVAKLLVIFGSDHQSLVMAQDMLVKKKGGCDSQINDLSELIHENLHNPRSLLTLVTLKIRKCLGSPLSVKLSGLPLPESIKKTIQLRNECDEFALTAEDTVLRGVLAPWMPARWINHDENVYASN